MFGTPYVPPAPSAPPPLAPVGVVLVANNGQILGESQNGATVMPALTGITPPPPIDGLTRDSNGVIIAGSFDQSGFVGTGPSFGDILLNGLKDAGIGLVAAGPVGAVLGFAQGTGEVVTKGGINELAGPLAAAQIVAGADAGLGSGIFGAGSESVALPTISDGADLLSNAGINLSPKLLDTGVSLATNGLSVNTFIKAGDLVLPDFSLPNLGDYIPDVSIPDVSGLNLPSSFPGLSDGGNTDFNSFLASNPSQDEIDAFQTALSGKPASSTKKPVTKPVTNTTPAAISTAPVPASAPQPLWLAALLLLKR